MSDFPVLRRTIVPLLRWRVTVRGGEHLPRSGGFLLVLNHQSYLDPPLVWLGLTPLLKRRMYFLTKEYIWRALRRGVGDRGLEWMGILPIAGTERAKVLDHALAKLKTGAPIVIFPEGTRNRNPEPVLLRGKTGAARLAHATGLPVVPAGLIAPPGRTKLEALRNFFSRKPALLTIGAPIRFAQLDDPSKEQLVATTTTIMRAIGALCGKEYRA